jgi:hypothetical protein
MQNIRPPILHRKVGSDIRTLPSDDANDMIARNGADSVYAFLIRVFPGVSMPFLTNRAWSHKLKLSTNLDKMLWGNIYPMDKNKLIVSGSKSRSSQAMLDGVCLQQVLAVPIRLHPITHPTQELHMHPTQDHAPDARATYRVNTYAVHLYALKY